MIDLSPVAVACLTLLLILLVTIGIGAVAWFLQWLTEKGNKNRSQECCECRFFEDFEESPGGCCRYNPPIYCTCESPRCSMFPGVYYSDWCSKFEYSDRLKRGGDK
jgi:hypothetical protein